jgi:hypothetical protein
MAFLYITTYELKTYELFRDTLTRREYRRTRLRTTPELGV